MLFSIFTQPRFFGKNKRADVNLGKSAAKRIFLCQLCRKTFTNKSNLNRHSVLHAGNFKWYCDICKKGILKRPITNNTLEGIEVKNTDVNIVPKPFRQKFYINATCQNTLEFITTIVKSAVKDLILTCQSETP